MSEQERQHKLDAEMRERLTILRNVLGLTLHQLADVCAISSNKINRIELGYTPPSLRYIMTICLGLGIPTTDICGAREIFLIVVNRKIEERLIAAQDKQ